MRFLKKFLPIVIIIVAIGCSSKDPEPVNVTVIPANFLEDNKYNQLIIEIQYMAGYQPTASTVANIQAFLSARLNKSAGITIVQNTIAPAGKSTYTTDDITKLESANRTQKTSGKILTAYVLFVDGGYSEDTSTQKVLGVTYGPTSIVVLEKTINTFTAGVNRPSPTVLESTVIEHEFGHIMGLVNRGTAMVNAHEDTAHERHCTDTNCLMYYLAETANMTGNLMGGTIPSLTGSCLTDLQNAGGK